MNEPTRSTMAPSEPFLNSGDFQEDLGMFEAATRAPVVELPEVSPKTILLATDGSNQDETARAVARTFAEAVGARLEEKGGLATAHTIQAAKASHGADLIVLPVPFGADISELREESLGETADRVLGNSLPLLAIRQAMDEASVRSLLHHVIVPLSPDNPRIAVALAWACRVLNGSGTLTVVEIADAQLRTEADELREQGERSGSNSGARVNRVLTRHFAGIIAAIQRRALDCGIALRVETTTGRFVESTLMQLSEPGLVILAGASDRRSDCYHQEADTILASRFPVLVV